MGDSPWSPSGTGSTPATPPTIPAHVGEVVRAAITSGETVPGVLYANTEVGIAADIGSITGDRTIFDATDNALDLDRIWLVDRGGGDRELRFNRGVLNEIYGTNQDFDVYFTANTDLILYLGIAGYSIIEIPITSANWRSIGPHYLNLTIPSDDLAALNSISADDVVNIVMAEAGTGTAAAPDDAPAAPTVTALLSSILSTGRRGRSRTTTGPRS